MAEEEPPEPESDPPAPEGDEPGATWRPGDRKIAQPSSTDGGLQCGYCRTPLDEDQTYCLNCGSPTPRAPRLRTARGAAAMIAIGLIVLGAGSGVLAYFVAQDDDETADGTTTTALTIPPAANAGDPGTGETDPVPDTTDTGELPTDTTATDTVTVPDEPFPTVTGSDPEPPAPTTEEPPVTPSPGGAGDWPAGRTGWTAFLASVRSEPDARAAAARLESQGTPSGVLFSSDHPNLEPGFWVVFSGVFDSQGPAASRATSLTSEFPGAYARRVQS